MTEYHFSLYTVDRRLGWQLVKAVYDPQQFSYDLIDMENEANEYMPHMKEHYFTACKWCTLDSYLKSLRYRGEQYDY